MAVNSKDFLLLKKKKHGLKNGTGELRGLFSHMNAKIVLLFTGIKSIERYIKNSVGFF